VGDVGTGQECNTAVGFIGAETEEQAACALVVRPLLRRDGETESGGEGLAEARNALQVIGRVEAHELPLAAVDGFDKRDLDLGEASCLEYEKKVSALFIRNVDFCLPRGSHRQH